MKYVLNPTIYSQIFAIPAVVADKHLKLCSGLSLKCLIVILRSPDQEHNINSLAKALNQPTSEICDALSYWLENNILATVESDLEQGTFAPVVMEKKAAPAPFVPKTPTPAAPFVPKAPTPIARMEDTAIPTINSTKKTRPHFSRDEAIAVIDNDKLLQGIMQEVENILGKPLTSADIDVLVALYSFYALSPHYIITLVDYCKTINKKSMGYAESTAVSWMSEGIDEENIDGHVENLMARKTNEGRIMTLFGIKNRSLITKEKAFIQSWFDKLNMDWELICYAYELTVERTGGFAFAYTNTILENWYKADIKTVDQAKNEQQTANKTPIANKKPAQMAKPMGEKTELDNKFLEQFMKE